MPARDHGDVAQRPVEGRDDRPVREVALGLRQRDAGAVDGERGAVDARLGLRDGPAPGEHGLRGRRFRQFRALHRRGRAHPARGEVALPGDGLRLKRALRLRPLELVAGERERALGVARLGLRAREIGAGDGRSGFGARGIDPHQHVALRHAPALLEALGQRHDPPAHRRAELEHAARPDLAERGQHGDDRLGRGHHDVDREHALARGRSAPVARPPLLKRPERDLRRPREQPRRQGEQKERGEASAEESHRVSECRP